MRLHLGLRLGAAAGVLVLVACGSAAMSPAKPGVGREAEPSTAPVVDSKTDKPPTASPETTPADGPGSGAATGAPATMPAKRKIGVASCDAYLVKLETCAQRVGDGAPLRDKATRMQADWSTGSSSGEVLSAKCTKALQEAKVAYATQCPGVFDR